ncbi:DNA polymerase theta [Anabrus simplex]|uniref:DNA polymerase theta n=1 Tax=Anabrus simplex TaxID=316456 RepID=UPI0035A36DDA
MSSGRRMIDLDDMDTGMPSFGECTIAAIDGLLETDRQERFHQKSPLHQSMKKSGANKTHAILSKSTLLENSAGEICNVTRKPQKPNESVNHSNVSFFTTQEKQNLASWGLPEPILKQYKSHGIISMFPWQVECLSNARVLSGGNLVYSAPTSAGKTLVAEILAIKTVLERKKKVMIILPFVSVVREKMFYFQDLLSSSGVRVEGLMGSHSLPGGFRSVNIAVCTIEKANSLINRLMEEGCLKDLGAIVVDELHLLGDQFRGYILELMLTKIKYMCTMNSNISVQIIGMSATLPNLDLLAKWLGADLFKTDFRPIPLREFLKVGPTVYDKEMKLLYHLRTEYNFKDDPDHIIHLCLETIFDGHSSLIFCPTKNWCEKLAESIAKELRTLGNSGHPLGLKLREQLDSGAIAEALEQLKMCPVGLDAVLKKVVAFGVAFHHAGLTLDERDIIENLFRKGTLRILVATSTLSSGVNLPARRVIVRTPLFHGKPLEIQVYQQMIGRAGRMGKDTAGESFLVCSKGEQKIAQQIIQAGLKPIESCLGHGGLSSSLKRAILEVVASGVAETPEQVQCYTNCTLLATTQSQLDNPVETCITFLVENEFMRLQTSDNGTTKYVPSPLGRACLAASLPPDEGLELFQELQRARQCFVLENELHVIYLVTPYSVSAQWGNLDWLQVLSMWEQLPASMRRVGELVGVEERFMVRAMRGTLNLKSGKQRHKLSVHRRFYTSLALQDLVNEIPLNEVAHKFHCSRGMLQSLQQSAATFAGMVTAFCKRLEWGCMELLVSQFQDRLEFGIHRELCDLMRLDLLNGPRARVLFNAGITSLVELASSDVCTVENALHKLAPFESAKEHDGETSFDTAQRNQLKTVWVTGKEGLTEKEAAMLLIKESRAWLKKELGLVDAKWEPVETRNEGSDYFSHSECSEVLDSEHSKLSERSFSGNEEPVNSGSPDVKIGFPKPSRKRLQSNTSPVFPSVKKLEEPAKTELEENDTSLVIQKESLNSKLPDLESAQINVHDLCLETDRTLSSMPSNENFIILNDENLKENLKRSSVDILNTCRTLSFGSDVESEGNNGNDSNCIVNDVNLTDEENISCLDCHENMNTATFISSQDDENLTLNDDPECKSNYSPNNSNTDVKVAPLSKSNLHVETPIKGLLVATKNKPQKNSPVCENVKTPSKRDSLDVFSSPSCENSLRSPSLFGDSIVIDTQLCNALDASSKSLDKESKPTVPLDDSPKLKLSNHKLCLESQGYKKSTEKQTQCEQSTENVDMFEIDTQILKDLEGSNMLPSSVKEVELQADNAKTTLNSKEICRSTISPVDTDNEIEDSFIIDTQLCNALDVDNLEGKGTVKGSPRGKLKSPVKISGHKLSVGKWKNCISGQRKSTLHNRRKQYNSLSKTSSSFPNSKVSSSPSAEIEPSDSLHKSQLSRSDRNLAKRQNYTQSLNSSIRKSSKLKVGLSSTHRRKGKISPVKCTYDLNLNGKGIVLTASGTKKLERNDDDLWSTSNKDEVITDSFLERAFTTYYQADNDRNEHEDVAQNGVIDKKEDNDKLLVCDGSGSLKSLSTPCKPRRVSPRLMALENKIICGELNSVKKIQPQISGKENIEHTIPMNGQMLSSLSKMSEMSNSGLSSFKNGSPERASGQNKTRAKKKCLKFNKIKNLSSGSEDELISSSQGKVGAVCDGLSGKRSSPLTKKKQKASSSSHQEKKLSELKQTKVEIFKEENCQPAVDGSTVPKETKIVEKSDTDWQSLHIIDVCGHKKIFDSFWAESALHQHVSLAIACESYSPPEPNSAIGNRILGRKRKHVENVADHDLSWDDRIVTGVAVSFGHKEAYYLSLDPNYEGGDGAVSVPLHDRLSLVKNMVSCNDRKHILRVFDVKEQCKVLYHCCGFEIERDTYDPKVADWLLEPEGKEKNLQALVMKFIPAAAGIVGMAGNMPGVGSIALSIKSPLPARLRSCVEAVVTWHIVDKQLDKLNEYHFTKIYKEVEMPTILCLARMELNGIGFSKDEAEKLHSVLNKHTNYFEERAYKLAGHSFSLTSPHDVAKVLFVELGLKAGKQPPGHKSSTSKEVLTKLKDQHPLPFIILQWRKISAILTKMVFPLLQAGTSERIFSCCVTHTATGRISMHEPNLQNIPRDFDISTEDGTLLPVSMRLAFVPKKGRVFVSADYSQLELRLLAHLSGDATLLEILRSGQDVFRSIAASWDKIPESEVTDVLRQRAKQVCYGMVYGIGPKALAEQLDIEEPEAAVFMETFKNAYPGVKKFLQDVVKQCQEKGYIETLFGRRRYLASINHVNPVIRAQAERQAVNSTVQGSAADVAKKGMVLVEANLKAAFPNGMIAASNVPRLKGAKRLRADDPIACLVLHVHDELLCEVSSEHLTQVMQIIKSGMEAAADISVPLPVKVKFGPSWGSLREGNI